MVQGSMTLERRRIVCKTCMTQTCDSSSIRSRQRTLTGQKSFLPGSTHRGLHRFWFELLRAYTVFFAPIAHQITQFANAQIADLVHSNQHRCAHG